MFLEMQHFEQEIQEQREQRQKIQQLTEMKIQQLTLSEKPEVPWQGEDGSDSGQHASVSVMGGVHTTSKGDDRVIGSVHTTSKGDDSEKHASVSAVTGSVHTTRKGDDSEQHGSVSAVTGGAHTTSKEEAPWYVKSQQPIPFNYIEGEAISSLFDLLFSLKRIQKTSPAKFQEESLRRMDAEWKRQTLMLRVAFDASSFETVDQVRDFCDVWGWIYHVWWFHGRSCKFFIRRLNEAVKNAQTAGAENETQTSSFESLADRVLSEWDLADRAFDKIAGLVKNVNAIFAGEGNLDRELTSKNQLEIQAKLDMALLDLKRFRAHIEFLEKSVAELFRLQPHMVKKLTLLLDGSRDPRPLRPFFMDLFEEYRGDGSEYEVGVSDSGFARFRQLLPS